MRKLKKIRDKVICEICGLDKKNILHRHHIIPRMDPRSTDINANIGILCPNCHNLVHSGEIIIIGVYKTTGGVELMWFRKGDLPPLPQEFWQVKDNPLVITLSGEDDDLPD